MKVMNFLHIVTLILITICSILSAFVDAFALDILSGVSVIILIVVLFARTSGFLRVSYTAFFVLSIILTFAYHIPFRDALDNMISYTVFIALYTCIPLIMIPVQLGKFMDGFIPIVKSIPNQFLRPVVVVETFTFSSFMNLGGISIADQLFTNVMNKSPKLYGKILSRAFGMGIFWSPYFAAFSVAVSYSHGTPISVMVVGLILCFLILSVWILPWLMDAREKGLRIAIHKKELWNLRHLFIFYGLLVVSVILFSYFTELSVILIIAILSIIFSVLGTLLIGKMKEFAKPLRQFVVEKLPKVREEGFLFIAIGFFANTLLHIGWQLHFPEIGLLSAMFVFLFILVFNFIVIALASVGVHHLVTISLITATINWQDLGVTPVVYAMTILLSWALSSMTSPFSPANIITSRITEQTPFQIGIQANGPFGFSVLVGVAVFLTLMNSFLIGP